MTQRTVHNPKIFRKDISGAAILSEILGNPLNREFFEFLGREII